MAENVTEIFDVKKVSNTSCYLLNSEVKDGLFGW